MAMMPEYQRKVLKAKSDIEKMLETCKSTYCSVSWGKDSIVLAHLILSENPNAKLVHWGGDQEKDIADFDSVSTEFLQKFGGDYHVISDESLMDGRLSIAGRDWSINNGFDGVFMGLTADESKARRFALGKAAKNNIYHYASGGLSRCCPLKNWKLDDIVAYIAGNDLPVLNLYKRYGLQIRTSSRIKKSGFTNRGMDHLNSTQQEKVKEAWHY